MKALCPGYRRSDGVIIRGSDRSAIVRLIKSVSSAADLTDLTDAALFYCRVESLHLTDRLY